MLKELMTIWRRQGLMTKVVEAFGQMLRDDAFVFTHAWDALAGKYQLEEIAESIHEKDKAVNHQERTIRKMLVEHLSMNPGPDIPGCLAIMSLVKDAERIGDYSKNIFDLAVVLKGRAKDLKYFERLSAIQVKLRGQLEQLDGAFQRGDEQISQRILGEYAAIKTDCTQVLEELFTGTLPARDAVATALLSRFLKRVNSHISNIASGLVYPIDEIDFVRGGILD